MLDFGIEILFGVAIAVFGIIVADKTMKALTGKGLWDLLNDKLRDVCDNIRHWLKDHHSFGAEVIRFCVCKVDGWRAWLNRNRMSIKVTVRNRRKQEAKVTERVLSAEECKELGIEIGKFEEISKVIRVDEI